MSESTRPCGWYAPIGDARYAGFQILINAYREVGTVLPGRCSIANGLGRWEIGRNAWQ